MVSSIIAEFEELILTLTGDNRRKGVSPQAEAMENARTDWPQYTELVQEAARLLEQRGLIVISQQGTRYRRP